MGRKIGVVGYSGQKFDEDKANILIISALDELQAGPSDYLVSGLTDLGIPALAYREAVSRGMRTVGVACSKATEYKKFPVDETIIIGDEWGDESDTFLGIIDCLIKIGGGKQSEQEFNKFNKQKIEFKLEPLLDEQDVKK